jgi:hypothetical protein
MPNLFSELLKDFPHKPHKGIVGEIDYKQFSLSHHPVFNYKPEYLAATEYKISLKLFQDRFGLNVSPNTCIQKVMNLYGKIEIKEFPHTIALQKIAIETIQELYNVPNNIVIGGQIQSHVDLNTVQNTNTKTFKQLSPNQQQEMTDQINKRIILNALSHGSSMHIWKSVYHLVVDKLNNLDPELLELYNKLTAGVNLGLWLMKPDLFQETIRENKQFVQGFNKVEFGGDNKINISCYAMNFPVLLHEVNKGVIDSLSCHGIPNHFSEEELEYYYSQADNYQDELWHYLLSPTLWNDLLETVQVESIDLPKIIMQLSKLPPQILTEIFISMMDDKNKAKIKLEVWKII